MKFSVKLSATHISKQNANELRIISKIKTQKGTKNIPSGRQRETRTSFRNRIRFNCPHLNKNKEKEKPPTKVSFHSFTKFVN